MQTMKLNTCMNKDVGPHIVRVVVYRYYIGLSLFDTSKQLKNVGTNL